MEATSIYRKTEAAAASLTDRRSGLPPRERMVLVMVDGRRSAHELARLSPDPAATLGILEDLARRGLVEPVSSRASTQARDMPDTGSRPLPDAKRHAVQLLVQMMGPAATDLCLRLESSRTRDEFEAAVKRTESILRDAFGPQKAALFVATVGATRP